MLYSRLRTCAHLHPAYMRKPDTPLICTLMWIIYMTARSRGDLAGHNWTSSSEIWTLLFCLRHKRIRWLTRLFPMEKNATECDFNRSLFERHLLNLTKSCSCPLPPMWPNNAVFVSEHFDSLPPFWPSYFIVFFSHPINRRYTSNHFNIPLVQIYASKCLPGE